MLKAGVLFKKFYSKCPHGFSDTEYLTTFFCIRTCLMTETTFSNLPLCISRVKSCSTTRGPQTGKKTVAKTTFGTSYMVWKGRGRHRKGFLEKVGAQVCV